MRFPEFNGEWNVKRLDECVTFLDEQRKPIKSTERSSEYKLYPYYGASGVIDYVDDYIFNEELILLSEDGANILDRNYRVAFIVKGKTWVNNHAHVLRPMKNVDISYLSEYLESLKYEKYNTGSTMPKLNQEVCRSIKILLPEYAEQVKIGILLSAINERIATQIKIIEKLESLIKGLCQTLFNFEEYSTYFLGDICSITTGKLDANAMVENGKYPFFTCAEEVFSIDEYAFDAEALLISGNGANLGYIHYYNGKFNAYQRTYVLDKFAIDINYVRLYLETFLKYRIEQEKNTGNTPYIVLGTLSKMKIKVPNTITQQKIIQSIATLKEKFSIEKQSLKKYEEQKRYLLSNLFI